MESKILVTLDLPTPIYYANGDDPIIWTPPTESAHHYIAKTIKAPKIVIGNPVEASWYIVIDDDDWSLHDALDADVMALTNAWGNFSVSFRQIVRYEGSSEWITHNFIAMTKTETQQDMNDREMKILLSGSVGDREHACLLQGDRDLFPKAPAATDVITHAGRPVRFSSGTRSKPEPPAGEDDLYLGSSIRRPMGRVTPDEPVDIGDAIGGAGWTQPGQQGTAMS
ncbi:hypothetical protein N9X87_00120 [bacterium]|nr:hypothetical protein [bacterium]